MDSKLRRRKSKDMNWRDSKELLAPFDKILVTGPARSGTTISARIIASELKYKFIDESWYEGRDVIKFKALISLERPMVIQTTGFAGIIHAVAQRPRLAIVLIKRNIKDILESMDNTLKFNEEEKHEGYFTAIGPKWKKSFFDIREVKSGCIPQIVYDEMKMQRKHIPNYFEMEYESLKDHPLWIDKKERRETFTHIKQIDRDPNYIRHKTGFMIFNA